MQPASRTTMSKNIPGRGGRGNGTQRRAGVRLSFSRSDTTALQAAIQGGVVGAVGKLLGEMTDAQQKAQLSARYGGSKENRDSPDKHGLYAQTTPMLHAALIGNSDAFSAIHWAMRPGPLKPQLKAILKKTDDIHRTVLAAAASSGKIVAFKTVLCTLKKELDPTEVNAMMKVKDTRDGSEAGEGRSLLAAAADTGNHKVFRAVRQALEAEMTEDEEYRLIAPVEHHGHELLLTALSSKEGKKLGLLKEMLTAVEETFTGSRLQNQTDGKAVLRGALQLVEITLFEATARFAKEHLANRKVAEEIEVILLDWAERDAFEGHYHKDFTRPDISAKIEELTSEPSEKFLQDTKDHGKLLDWVKMCLSGPLVSSKNPFVTGLTLSVAFARAAESAPEEECRELLSLQQSVDNFLLEVLERLPQTVRGFDGRMDDCSALLEAKKVEEDSAPRAVSLPAVPEETGTRSIDDTTSSTAAAGTRRHPLDRYHRQADATPLQMMLGKRKQRHKFCKAPLVMDFLSRKFSLGLPNLRDTSGVLGDWAELLDLAGLRVEKTRPDKDRPIADGTVRPVTIRGDSLVLGSSLCFAKRCRGPPLAKKSLELQPPVLLGEGKLLNHVLDPVVLLQGADADLPGLAGIPFLGGFPGLQFIVAGIVANPSHYYGVPAMRMAFDFVVYVAMLAIFSTSVLFHNDGPLTPGEVIFFVSFVAAGAYTEGREIARNVEAYFGDRWNILDILYLTVLTGGFAVRITYSTSPWGRALYAMSAPLLFSRVLFFAQILRFQGPMIQVIFSMTAELIQFATVMLVVMLGFVMAFHALFLGIDTHGDAWLNLFKAMLGDTELFDDFSDQDEDSQHESATAVLLPVATVMLVVYLIIMTIMLLNLLIAVLSTLHSKVEQNVDREYKVSKARMIQHYRMVVDEDLLPAPFNLVQLVVAGACTLADAYFLNVSASSTTDMKADNDAKRGQSREALTKRRVGQVVFWIVLCPLAALVGGGLWVMSAFYAPYAWTRHYLERGGLGEKDPPHVSIGFVVLRWLAIVLWCVLVAPVFLFAMWVGAPWRWMQRLGKKGLTAGDSNSSCDGEIDVNSMLKKGPGGAGASALFKYLQDPVSDPLVRRDEIDRATTVQHIKLLRNRLETTVADRADELRVAMMGNIDQIRDPPERMMEELRGVIAKQDQRVDKKLDCIVDMLAGLRN